MDGIEGIVPGLDSFAKTIGADTKKQAQVLILGLYRFKGLKQLSSYSPFGASCLAQRGQP